ncbi:hypothetical protein A2U01_0084612 [Trifolium medium]|uniref:Uncharacterized protein n=1 Tax=Trifolium medium TaxID=97028 RepID=A0A392TU38_9FABA|nr:hypothetical protein [Trifolium medium]
MTALFTATSSMKPLSLGLGIGQAGQGPAAWPL